MKALHLLAATAIVVILSAPVWADPPSWNLAAVTISTGMGRLEGFTAWSDSDPFDKLGMTKVGMDERHPCMNGWHLPGCLKHEDILRMLKLRAQLMFFTDLVWINYPDKVLVTRKPVQHFKEQSISSVTLRTHVLNSYRWYGPMLSLSDEDVKRLQTPPMFQCRMFRGWSTYWMSYSSRFGKEELKSVCDQELTIENKEKVWNLAKELDRESDLILLAFPDD